MKPTRQQYEQIGRMAVDYSRDSGGCLFCWPPQLGYHDDDCPMHKALCPTRKVPRRRKMP